MNGVLGVIELYHSWYRTASCWILQEYSVEATTENQVYLSRWVGITHLKMSSRKRDLPQSVASTSSDDISSKDKGPQRKRKQASTFEDFPVSLANPFETDCCGSDITLLVEGKKLHAHRTLLSVYCSYFRVLLASDHFSEAGAKEIELKSSEFVEVKYDVMVKFLLHLYPVHSFKGITDDQTLMDLFPLAEYFQCQHVRTKCVSYIRQQIGSVTNRSSLSVKSALLYLHLCEKYQMRTFVERLVGIVSCKSLKDIQAEEHFSVLTPEMQRDIFQQRVKYVEERIFIQQKAAEEIFTIRFCSKLLVCQKCRKETVSGHTVCSECASEFKCGFSNI